MFFNESISHEFVSFNNKHCPNRVNKLTLAMLLASCRYNLESGNSSSVVWIQVSSSQMVKEKQFPNNVFILNIDYCQL